MKANAYGLGCDYVAANIVDLVDSFAVATICEGEALCNLGLGKDIYVLGGIDYDEISNCTSDLIHSVTCKDDIEFLAKLSAKLRCQFRISLKINCGMNRLGAKASCVRAIVSAIDKANAKHKFSAKRKLDEIIKSARLAQPEVTARLAQPEVTARLAQPEVTARLAQPEVTARLAQPEVTARLAQPEVTARLRNQTKSIELVSIFTHFSCGDDVIVSAAQFNNFELALGEIDGVNVITHACASSVLNLPPYCNMYRVGIAMYGYGNRDLKPSLSLHTNIVQVFKVKRGEFVGYGRVYCAARDMTVATIRIGYADGFMRYQPNPRYVEVRGKMAQVVGNICMDMCMVDVTDIRGVSTRDRAYIISEKLPAEELANSCNTIVYEVLTSISRRAVRKYLWTKSN